MKKALKHLSRPFSPSASQQGMTIIEILIVIALIGTIMAVMANGILKKYDEGKHQLTGVRQSRLSDSLTQYKLNNSRFPSTDEGLNALIEAPTGMRNWRGPYAEAETLIDTWSRPMQYELLNARSYKITSAGADGEFGNEDDVIYPKPTETAPEDPVTTELTVPKGNLE